MIAPTSKLNRETTYYSRLLPINIYIILSNDNIYIV